MNRRDVEDLRVNKSDDLCKLAEMLGYRGAINQLQCSNGAFVSSLMSFFDDNPGAMEAVVNWVLEDSNLTDEDECEDEDEYEDE